MPDRRELEANIGAVSRTADEVRLLADARRYVEQAERSRRDHEGRLRALEEVFGPAVRAAAEEHLERFTESSAEAFYSIDRVRSIVDEDRAALREELVHVRALLTNALGELGRSLAFPEEIVERAERYFVHTRRARPTWLRDALSEVSRLRDVEEHGTTREPF